MTQGTLPTSNAKAAQKIIEEILGNNLELLTELIGEIFSESLDSGGIAIGKRQCGILGFPQTIKHLSDTRILGTLDCSIFESIILGIQFGPKSGFRQASRLKRILP